MNQWCVVRIQMLPPLGHAGVRGGDETGHFLFRKEGVTQGDPLAMVAHVLVILPLIRELWKAHPDVT